MTQAELAQKSGTSVTTICNIETGEQGDPKAQTLEAIARALDVPLAALFASAPEVTGAEVGEIISRYMGSPWAGTAMPIAKQELEALERELPGARWIHVRPTAEAVHFLLMSIRATMRHNGDHK